MVERAKRALLPNTVTALEVITDFKLRRIRVPDFELAMSQRGLRTVDCRGALATFARRGWVIVDGSTLHLTDDGWLAVTQGVGVKTRDQKQRGKSGNRRMPAGLF